jgi:hypothetical protein
MAIKNGIEAYVDCVPDELHRFLTLCCFLGACCALLMNFVASL